MKTNNTKILHALHALHAIAIACTLVIAGCGSIEHTKGLIQVGINNPDDGIPALERATKYEPTDSKYKVDFLLKREVEVREILAKANDLRAEGNLEDAEKEYARVLGIDPKNPLANAAIIQLKSDARYVKLLIEGEKFLANGRFELAADRAATVLEDTPKNKRAIKLKTAADDARFEKDMELNQSRLDRSILGAPVTLQFVDTGIKTLFEAIAKSTGLNVLFDKDVKTDTKATVFLKDVSVSDAIDLILMQNQLSKRVVNGTTIMVFPSTSNKMAEYEDLMIRTYQISNADIKYLTTLLKSMLKVKEISADEKTGILVMRDTPEVLRMAERLIAAHDVPDPEIMLEVEVLEVSSSRDSNLGINPPNAISFSVPGASGAAASAGNALTLGALTSMSRDNLLVSPLSTTINLKLNDSDAKILASPRIRARNKEIAKIMIGDRVPTITNTVTPVNTGSSVVTGSVSYQDVGLKLEFEPQVYADSDVGIKINLEVSNIAKEFTDTNGGRSYQIGTRTAATNLRLKDGETQILGGLISDEDRNSAAKIPGLGHLPVIGKLFGSNAGTGAKSEIILAITPRIVRGIAVRAPEIKSIFSGTLNKTREKPILADPSSKLTLGGPISGDPPEGSGGSVSGGGDSGGINVNASKPATKFGSGSAAPASNSKPLSAPPPMVNRPAPIMPGANNGAATQPFGSSFGSTGLGR